jgi:hypothetical protein
VLGAWEYEHGVALEFIQPGKPIQNAAIESTTAGCAMSSSTRTGGAL